MLDLKPKFLEAAGGARLVILTEAEWNSIVDELGDAEEDAADAALYLQRKAALARGDDAVLPVEVSAAVLRGVGLLKALRTWRGLTQGELAEKTGLTQNYLSNIEAGLRNGRKDTLERIAAALDVPAAWLTPSVESGRDIG